MKYEITKIRVEQLKGYYTVNPTGTIYVPPMVKYYVWIKGYEGTGLNLEEAIQDALYGVTEC